GGISAAGGSIRIVGTKIRNNQATDDVDDPNDDDILPMGAGVLCSSAGALIQDCNLAGNLSEGSGGAIYLRGQNATSIFNCLLRDNGAFRDGGGISTNWYAQPTIRNCTFVGNAAPGTTGDPNGTGFGGAVFCGYLSEATVIDSILWNNFARQGAELAVGSGFELDPLCGSLHIAFSDLGTGPNNLYVDQGCELLYGGGIIQLDPLFVSGPLGDFHLSNRAVPGQSRTSPCVDTGSDFASAVGMSRYTTRTDRVPDTGLVDMGYHYPFLEPCRFADFVFDGMIQFNDFAMFALRWLDEGCSEADGWCGGADLTFDSQVDARDLEVLADCWLVQDTTPPHPDPSQWETEPSMSGGTAQMIAREAMDAWWGEAVEYYFDCVFGDCQDSGWQSSRVYNDGGLSTNTEHGYRVKARDPLGNETEWSPTRFAGAADTKPPAPAPYIVTIAADSSQQINVTSTTAFDDNGVQYFFDANAVQGGNDSGWIDTPFYTDIDLDPNTVYCYRVKARDLSANLNETEFSEWACVATDVPADANAPVPNPMAFDPNGLPAEFQSGTEWNEYSAEMLAVTATDDSGFVEYEFECDQVPGLGSGWQAEPLYTVLVGRQGQGLRFRVRARDGSGNKTDWSDWVPAIPRPEQPSLQPNAGGGAGGVGGGGGVVGVP
ncbi:MAG: right-handed parallel beta-helix repeat-containing protein, partial [Planctomycetota bacterium]